MRRTSAATAGLSVVLMLFVTSWSLRRCRIPRPLQQNYHPPARLREVLNYNGEALSIGGNKLRLSNSAPGSYRPSACPSQRTLTPCGYANNKIDVSGACLSAPMRDFLG
jgi:hypothetical protein